MIAILLTISFIIHFITIFIILILYQRTKLNNHEDPAEYEHIFQQYLEEIKQENQQLVQQLENKRGEQFSSVTIDPSNEKELNNYKPPVESVQEEDKIETSLTAQILALAEQGYQSSEIAQKLTCGETEVELVLKFQTEKEHID